MKNGLGEEITLIARSDKGREKEITEEELTVLTGAIHRNIPAYYARMLSRLDIIGIIEFSMLIFEKMILGDSKHVKELKDHAKKHYLGIDTHYLTVIVDGKQCTFSYFPEMFVLLKDIVISNQYNVKDENVKGKIVIDAGANIGFFTIYAAYRGAKKVYAFEPSPKTCEILRENIRKSGLENIEVVCKGLGESDYSCRFMEEGAGIGINRVTEDGNITVEITSIDNYFAPKNEKIGFIKMDTEGFEEPILKGARKTLQTDKPALCFSAYHRPEDLERLPEVLKEIQPEYSITLISFGEKDFYCEVKA